jgi:hypothetical protein
MTLRVGIISANRGTFARLPAWRAKTYPTPRGLPSSSSVAPKNRSFSPSFMSHYLDTTGGGGIGRAIALAPESPWLAPGKVALYRFQTGI